MLDTEQKLIAHIGIPIAIERVSVLGHEINYAVCGSGKPLLLIHGANIGWGEWYANIAQLAKHYRVFALDLPGSGNSSKIDFLSFDPEKEFVEVVEQFMLDQQLVDAVLLGHSIGGWAALRIAARRNVSLCGLILVNALGFNQYVPWGYRPLAFRFLATLLASTVMKPTRKNMRKFLVDVMHKEHRKDVPEVFIDYYHEAVTREPVTHPFLLIHRLFEGFTMKKEFFVPELLSMVQCPLFIMASANDPLLPVEKSVLSMNRTGESERLLFQNTGHVSPIEQPEQFNTAVMRFLASLT